MSKVHKANNTKVTYFHIGIDNVISSNNVDYTFLPSLWNTLKCTDPSTVYLVLV